MMDSVRGMRRRWSTGVWQRPDFRALFAAQTVSTFGTLISRTAIPFTAILELDAGPMELAILGVSSTAPAFASGLFAGAWIDRLPRKPIMVATDLARAAMLALVPLFWVLDLLSMPLLYVAVAVISICSVMFDIAYRSILPSIVAPDELLEANSRLTGSASVAEAASFSLGGWLVQLLSGPGAIAIDAVSFLWSAKWLRGIELDEQERVRERETSIIEEIRDGLHLVWHHGTLRALATYAFITDLAFSMFGAVFLLFVVNELGFKPGVLGVIFAIGGLAAIAGAAVAGRVTSALGFRRTIVLMTMLMGIGQASVTLATSATLFAVALLVAQQFLVDGPYTVVDVNTSTIRQLATDEAWQGRINSTVRVLEFGGGLIGVMAGGLMAEAIGLRPVLLIASGLIVLNGLVVRRIAEPDTRAVRSG